MENKFSPSINILRDQGKKVDYFPTPNAERVIVNLNKNVDSGIKSFYIVGSFGTGKSSFLLALENQISNGKKIFNTKITFNDKIKFQPFNLVGDYRSLEDSIREKLKISSKSDPLKELNKLYTKVSSLKKGLLFVIDEFGKYLEYASKNNPEKELYLIQKLAEFANDHSRNIIFITTLHQGFDVYRTNLDSKLKNEWDKVKGRLVEIPFNEPVDQLLHLASQYLDNKPRSVNKEELKAILRAIKNAHIYPLNTNINENLAINLYPLEILSAGILTKALQRYGQNERSLFTFLKTTDLSKAVNKKQRYYNLVSIYDYLIENFYSLLSSKQNPDYFKWSIIRNTLERNEIIFETKSAQNEKLIKTIGLLNIFSQKGAHLNKKFLGVYGEKVLGIPDVKEEIKALEKNKLIRYQSFSDSYVLFEGTDIDIDLALNDAEQNINSKPNVVTKLKEHFDFTYLTAKASYIKRGTPRFFKFILSETPIKLKPQEEYDGIINLIFNENMKLENIKAVSQDVSEAILYVFYKNANLIKTTIVEIEKINYVLNNTLDDRVVQRELKNLRENLINELNELVFESLFYENSQISWVFNGKEVDINSKTAFSKMLSEIIDKVYSKTPIFHNELINRAKLPGAITRARKLFLDQLMNHWDVENLGFPDDKFPSEKTIYLSLLKATGIHRKQKSEYILADPLDKSFTYLWKKCEDFINNSKYSKKNLLDLIEVLKEKPLKLKQGFIDFWLPVFLFIKRDDYALFEKDTYIPSLSLDLIDIIIKYPQHFYVKAFDVKGVKLDLFNRYRTLINKTKEDTVSNKNFIDTIRPFLTFYRSLPEYTKRTSKLSNASIALRNTIAKAKDPEKTFFEEFPAALGYSTVKLYESNKYLKDYVTQLKNSIHEIRTCYDELLNRIEKFLCNQIETDNCKFPDYKQIMIKRYASVKSYLLLPYQKTFYQRVTSQLDDRDSWLNSIIQALIGKNLNQINDDEEKIIYEKLKNILYEFDSFSEFTNLQINKKTEKAYKVEITSTEESLHSSIVRLSKANEQKVKRIEEKIKKQLGKDKALNKAALINLLKKELRNGKS